MQAGKYIAIVTNNYHKYSETFIHDCIRFWPGKLAWLYGDYLPTHYRMGVNEPEMMFRRSAANRSFRQIKNPRAKTNDRSLTEFLKALQPQALLTHYGPTGVSMMEIARQLSIPLFVHFHGYDAYRSDILSSYGLEYPKLFRTATGLIAVSEDMLVQLQRLGAPAKKLHLLRCGVEPADYSPKKLPSSPAFAFVGRFIEKKHPALVLHAFKTVLQQLPEARLTMTGDGQLRDRCEMLAAELGIASKVEFTGVLNRHSVAELMLQSTALVVPSGPTSDGDSEGSPVVVLEAGAAGRPVIASRHAGIPEVIDHEFNGILIEPGDVTALAEAMILLGKNPDLAHKMGCNGRIKVEAQFQRKDYLDNLASLVYGRCDRPAGHNVDKKMLTTT